MMKFDIIGKLEKVFFLKGGKRRKAKSQKSQKSQKTSLNSNIFFIVIEIYIIYRIIVFTATRFIFINKNNII